MKYNIGRYVHARTGNDIMTYYLLVTEHAVFIFFLILIFVYVRRLLLLRNKYRFSLPLRSFSGRPNNIKVIRSM